MNLSIIALISIITPLSFKTHIMSSEPIVHTCFEPQTATWQYVIADPATKTAVIIDPVLDFDPARNAISTGTADSLLALVKENGYTVNRLIETHAHADHLTAAHYLQHQLESSGKKPDICIGKRIGGVQERFAKRYGIDKSDYEGSFDHLVEDNEVFHIGNLEAKALHLPGHTPDHMGYVIGCTTPSPITLPLSPPLPEVPIHYSQLTQQTSSAATPSSTPTLAPRAAISPTATPTSSTTRRPSSSPSQTTSRFTPATTTLPAGRPGARTPCRTQLWPSSCSGGTSGTLGWRSRGSFTRRCSLTLGGDGCRWRGRMGIGFCMSR